MQHGLRHRYMKSFFSLMVAAMTLLTGVVHAESPLLPPKVKRILILGDSITWAGGYVDRFEAFLLREYPQRSFEVINLGLPSETVSGLSEPNHAGGAFPRPCLHDRLDAALRKTKPDLILACYGMNDGIMLPFDEGRFKDFQKGMEKLHDKATRARVEIVHITPPVYDAKEQGPITATGYEDVLQRYSQWLLDRRKDGWKVIDLHTPMVAAINEKRKTQPGFTFAGDRVHPNAAGHDVMAAAVIEGFDPVAAKDFLAWVESPAASTPPAQAFFKTITQRRQLLQNAWLTEVGHKRPGIAKGLPLDQAEKQAKDLKPVLPK